MKFQAKVAELLTHKSQCLVLPVVDGKKQPPATQTFDKACGNIVSRLLDSGDLKPRNGSTLLLTQQPGCSSERVLLIGVGNMDKAISSDNYAKLINSAALALSRTPAKNASVFFGDIKVANQEENWKARQLAKAFSNALYRFDDFKSSKSAKPTLKTVTYSVKQQKQVTETNKALKTGLATASGMSLAKTLGNLPGNVCTPAYLANQARKMARSEAKLSAKVLGQKQMQELGMGSFLSVAKGSDQEGKLIVLEYKGAKKSEAPFVLVGKGITFDTGGISLKPGAAMDEMKYDMCGAASVFGTLQSVVELQLPINLVVIVAAAENMPSGGASKPGDIVTSMSGKTIEILNTDAEGRLVLCDALTYAERFKPKAVIDVATLTGACVVALGAHATGLYSNDDKLANTLLQAGVAAQDKAWQMPLWDEYQSQLDSNFADMANIGGPKAGSVTAACFLARFTESYPWAHLDIAGTAWHSGANKGATGRPVSLLLEYLMQGA
ncbi:MAG: leucyl aminopeptidase [Candidatus Pelagadaptatus aseana]|uniref:leucyl aminopeptidase n=1 Tax=Candidatus Pelagadaptatus aseana TaxID=3120508 RepID=UPI0039B23DC3